MLEWIDDLPDIEYWRLPESLREARNDERTKDSSEFEVMDLRPLGIFFY
jgi:hypothetical protein